MNIFTEILRLNIWDLNHVNTNIQPAVYSSASAFSINNGIGKRLRSFAGHFAAGFLDLIRSPQPHVRAGDAVLYVTTQNQLSSLLPLMDELPEGTLLSDRHQVKSGYRYPAFWAHLLSLLFLPLTVFRFYRSRREHDLLFLCRNGLDRYLVTYGYYVVSRLWLRHYRPGVVVVSNDSAVFQRSLCLAAHHEGIPTVFIQHASASPLFPTLMFDFALLDGSDALETYERPHSGSKTKIFLVGMPKFDRYYGSINRKQRAESIGIGVNMLDPLENVKKLISQLRAHFPDAPMHLRPHPRENRMTMWEELADEFNLSISNANAEDVFAFLSKVDLIIAGNSSIHVEAVMLNVYSITYNFQPHSDYKAYSFVERGLSVQAADPARVCAIFSELRQEKKSIRHKAKPYCATIGTHFDGLSSVLAAEIIGTIAAGETPRLDDWQRIEDCTQEAYELIASW